METICAYTGPSVRQPRSFEVVHDPLRILYFEAQVADDSTLHTVQKLFPSDIPAEEPIEGL